MNVKVLLLLLTLLELLLQICNFLFCVSYLKFNILKMKMILLSL